MLDKLVDAASNAEAEVREEFTVEDILIEEGCATGIRDHGKGGKLVTEHVRVGRRSGGPTLTRCVLSGRAFS